MKRFIAGAALAAATAALLPAAASANTVVSPGALTFPERQVGSASDPQIVTVTVICNTPQPAHYPPCPSIDTYSRNPSFAGDNPGDFSFVNVNCPSTISSRRRSPRRRASSRSNSHRPRPVSAMRSSSRFRPGWWPQPGGSHRVGRRGTATDAGQEVQEGQEEEEVQEEEVPLPNPILNSQRI